MFIMYFLRCKREQRTQGGEVTERPKLKVLLLIQKYLFLY